MIRYKHINNPNDRKGYCRSFGLNEKALQAALKIEYQLKKYLKKYKIPIVSSNDDPEEIMKCILTGFFDKAAQRQADGSYKSVRGKEVFHLHPQSIMIAIFPDWVIYNEVSILRRERWDVFRSESRLIKKAILMRIRRILFIANKSSNKQFFSITGCANY